MLQKKRQLKKVKQKSTVKFLILILLFFLTVVLLIEYYYLNYSVVGTNIVSPVAEIQTSKMSDLESILKNNKISFSSIDVNPDSSFTVNLTGDGVVILSSKKDIRAQLSSLQLILSRLTIEGKKLKSLDLRFGSPVISFKYE